MAHQHPVKDTDLHFVIDPVTRVVKNNSGKIVIMQHDHQSEILTFELPRYIDTHDMSLSNTVRVHYINIGTSSKYTPVSGVYEVNDLQVDANNENLVTCSWTLTNNTTQLEGTLNFIIRFSCLTGDTIDYSWSTAIYSGIIVAKTIDSSDYVMTAIPDILEQWKESLKGDPFTYEDFTPEQLEGLRGPAGIVISETEPTNEDHPVWLNPNGEVGLPDLDITGASVGQVPVVKSVDGNGKPTEWEAGDSKPFVVTVTYGNDDTLTADKTHAEIVSAYASGAQINAKIVNYPGIIVPSILPLYVNNSDTDFIFSGSGVLKGRAMAMTAIDTNGSWSVSLTELATPGDIPSSSTDTSLGLTGATVGQVPAVKAVDGDGKPTEWEAVDMPSGGEREWIKIGEVTTAEDTTEAFYMKFTKDINGNSLSMKGVLIIGTPLFSDAKTHNCNLRCQDIPYGSNANYFLNRSILRNKQTFTIYSEFLRGDGVNSVVATMCNSGNVKQLGGVESYINTWSPNTEALLQFPMRGIVFGVMDSGLLAGSKFEFWGVKA